MAETGEPTYTDDAGVERPGAQDLKGTINPTTKKEIDAVWKDHYADSQLRNRKSAQFPNVSDPYSHLDQLINAALQEFGNMNTDTIGGEIRLMLLRKANEIIEDVRIHPYGDLPDLDYYVSIHDIRPIPDPIMIAGLLYHYTKWKKASTIPLAERDYYRTLGQVLYQRKYGSGKIQTNTIDKEEAPE